MSIPTHTLLQVTSIAHMILERGNVLQRFHALAVVTAVACAYFHTLAHVTTNMINSGLMTHRSASRG